MAHDTTMLAQVRKGSPSPPLESLDKGHSTGRPRVEVEGQRFRVQTSRFSTEWLPDTPSNRHTTVVWLRLVVGERGRPLFTLQELAALVGSDNRQAASQHLEDFRQCGEDFRTFVLRKRKVDGTVVEAVLKELLKTPLAGPTELVPRVNAQLGRDDVTAANIDSALEQISCVPVLKTVRRQLEVGHVQYREAYLLAEMLESVSPQVAQYAGAGVPRADRGMKLADPTALTALVTPDLPLQQVPDSLCWLTFIMTLFYWNVPLSVLGRWWGVHKTTILRWVLGLALALLVRRLGCHHRAAGAGGLTAVAEPMGLSLGRLPAAPAQESPPSHHHGWVTGLCLPGAGGQAHLVSFSSPARGDPVVEAAFHDRGRDQHAQDSDEEGVSDPG